MKSDPDFSTHLHRYSYERDAIKDWLQKHDTSPMTNEKLESKHLIPNLALRAAIRVMYS